jgi:hypothetical protein
MTAGIASIALILTALLAVPISRRLTGDYFSPPAIVLIAWCGTLGLYALHLLPYAPMTDGTAALIAAAVTLLVGGAIAGARLAGSRAATVSGARVRLARPALWTTGYAVVGLAGSAWYVWSVTMRLGADAFLDGEELRGALNRGLVPSSFLFLQFFALAAALLAVALWQTGQLRARHLLLPGLCALGTLITTDRTQSFTLIVTAGLIAAFHLGPRLRAAKLLAAAVLVPALLVANFVAVGAWRAQSWRAFQSQVSGAPAPAPAQPGTPAPAAPGSDPAANVPPQAGSVWQGRARQLSMLYFYATASYPALDQIRRADRPRTHGAHTFYPIVRALERLHVVAGPLPSYIPAFLPVAPAAGGGAPLSTNASTFLYYPLEDFGVPGSLGYALIVGLASGLAYGWMRRDRDSAARLLLAGQVSTALLLTIFVNKFNNTGSWYVLLLTLAPFAARWLRDRQRDRQRS